MGFKVASRVRGLSDEAFREAFGTEEQCRTALVRLRWPDGFVCPCCGHREHLRAGGSGPLSMQPVQEADIAHGGHDLPRDQAAADTLVRSHPPDRDGEERHLVGGTRPPSRGQAADGLDRKHKIMAVMRGARGRHGLRGGWRWTTPISAGCAPAASGAAARRARRPSWRRSRPVPRGAHAS